jgi:hypothetical protein
MIDIITAFICGIFVGGFSTVIVLAAILIGRD